MICLNVHGRVKVLFDKMESVSSSTSGKKKTKAYAINVENPLGFLETKMGNSLLT